jgi:hypothetical protein
MDEDQATKVETGLRPVSTVKLKPETRNRRRAGRKMQRQV